MFESHPLIVESCALKKNPLRDPAQRANFIFLPKKFSSTKKCPLVFFLPAFGSSAAQQVVQGPFKGSLMEKVMHWVSQKKAPQAVYVVVDAATAVGGSQYINSKGVGSYEDYIVKELYPQVAQLVSIDPKRVALCGASSGGYGALHLASSYPELFPYLCAVAPDSFFQASLLPEIYKAYPYIKLKGLRDLIRGFIAKRSLEDDLRESVLYTVAGALAAGLCYSSSEPYKVQWPINKMGVLDTVIWKKWLKYDPIMFLPQRKNKVSGLKGAYLSVGIYDEYNLQYGARQIYAGFKKNNPTFARRVVYREFKGGHFGLKDNFVDALTWLVKEWNDV